MAIICWLKTIWRTLYAGTWVTGIPMMGHDYEVEEDNIPATVTTAKCKHCGHYSIGWERK